MAHVGPQLQKEKNENFKTKYSVVPASLVLCKSSRLKYDVQIYLKVWI